MIAIVLVAFLAYYSGLDIVSSLVIGCIFSITYSLISFYFSDKATLAVAGAKEVNKQQAPDIIRLIENLSITGGIPTPKVYIINDPSPNAFATGRDPEHASIAFTTGILKILNKQELEGVAAHELSHIKNYDIRLMTVVVILIGLIVLISELIFRIGFFRGSGRDKGGNAIAILLIVGLILGILSPIIAQLIKLAVSRTREYLADQSGAMLTRYPEGLASALEKIRDNSQKMRRANHATAHLYISNPFGTNKNGKTGFMARLFMTHPPINDRIRKLRAYDS